MSVCADQDDSQAAKVKKFRKPKSLQLDGADEDRLSLPSDDVFLKLTPLGDSDSGAHSHPDFNVFVAHT